VVCALLEGTAETTHNSSSSLPTDARDVIDDEFIEFLRAAMIPFAPVHSAAVRPPARKPCGAIDLILILTALRSFSINAGYLSKH